MTIGTQGLSKQFPDETWGLKNLTINFSSGEFVLITGHNGSGKSLLIRHLFGLENPTQGQILLNGTGPVKDFTPIRQKVALVFQEPEHQILGLTVQEDIQYTPRQSKGGRKSDLSALTTTALAQVGLEGFENHLTAFLSGGEKRRLAIASALITHPEILILDEPFNGLDWGGAKTLLEILKGLHNKGLGIIVVTHDLEKCLALADRLVILEKGEKILDDTPKALWDQIPLAGLRRLPGPVERLKEMSWLP